MKNKKTVINEIEEKEEKKVKLKSEMYNHDNEKLDKRDEDNSEAVMWGCVIGFILFFILLIMMILFVR